MAESSPLFNSQAIESYIFTLKEFYKRIELLNFQFPEEYEKLIIQAFEPIKFYNIIGEGIFPIIERVTINKNVIGENVRIYEERKLKYPPEEFVKRYGRANLKNQSVFYGTFNFMTAIKEMRPAKGDLITVSRWTLRHKHESIVVCPMFLHQPNDGSSNNRLKNLYNWFVLELKRFPPEIAKLLHELHQFYSDCFAREIDENNNQGYIYTALLANKIMNQYQGGIVDAILYPSTKEDLRTENIAIKKVAFNRKYQLSETIEKRLIDYTNGGKRYVFERTSESEKIDGDYIVWK